jgi:hypothetical protein
VWYGNFFWGRNLIPITIFLRNQDRLGTNIGKVEKKRHVSAGYGDIDCLVEQDQWVAERWADLLRVIDYIPSRSVSCAAISCRPAVGALHYSN